GVVDLHVIAAFAVEWHAVTRRSGEGPGMDAGGDHGGVTGNFPDWRHYRGNVLAVAPKTGCRRPHTQGTPAFGICRETGDIAARIAAVAGFGNEHSAAVLRRESGKAGGERVALDHFPLEAGLAPQLPRQR